MPVEDQFTSSITLGEIVYGAERNTDRRDFLIRILDEVVLPNLGILPFDAQAARQYGVVKAQLERRGTPIGDADTRIASVALTHGLVVVTANRRHFDKVPGLRVENWLL